MAAAELVELWRGGLLEGTHRGHAVICDEKGGIVESWGDPDAVIFPRSSCKMIQALPLIESGAADRAGLTDQHLALACASHQGAEIHTSRVDLWLKDLGLSEADLRCGAHVPYDEAARDALYRHHAKPCQLHNNCSGKHAGFLTLNQHLGGGSEYVEVDHPVQQAVREATEEMAQETAAGFGIDGCSAPNFAISIHGLARSVSYFAAARDAGSVREKAAYRLTRAMATNPELVAGEKRACTNLMRAMEGRVAVKTGAEAVFIAIVPEKKLGIAVKVMDGQTRASEAAITALLVRVGALDNNHPVVAKYLTGPQKNWRGLVTGELRLAAGFC